jgi:hypothetical protein
MDATEWGSAAGDPEQIGKTGGRPRATNGVARMLGRSLGKGWLKRSTSGRAKSKSSRPRGYRQRVVVKALVVKHGTRSAGNGSRPGSRVARGGSLARHVRYLGRDGTSERGGRGQFYDRETDALDAASLTKAWRSDCRPGRVCPGCDDAGRERPAFARPARRRAPVAGDQPLQHRPAARPCPDPRPDRPPTTSCWRRRLPVHPGPSARGSAPIDRSFIGTPPDLVTANHLPRPASPGRGRRYGAAR